MAHTVVTGGAGFIGSHLVDRLVERGEVVVVDDLSAGRREHVHRDATLVDAPLGDVLDDVLPGAESVWHLAANPEVRTGATDPAAHYDANVALTWQLLEGMRQHDVRRLGFTSTSTVYGEATVLPTPESYGPLLPISVYGGAKLACEALISSFSGTFGFDSALFRFANVVGPRSDHGVIIDFVRKLRATPERLEILGDGTQTKSYVHVDDTVDAMLHAADALWRDPAPRSVPFNIGSADGISVMELAHIVADVMNLEPAFETTGGTASGAGWVGDVKNMGLALDGMAELGWTPKRTSAEAVRAAAASLASTP